MHPQQTASPAPSAPPCPVASAHAAVPWIHLNAITGMLAMVRAGSKAAPAAVCDYIFGYVWALQNAGVIDRYQEGLIIQLSRSALRHCGAPGFNLRKPAERGSPPCPDQT